jgi:hypothetical protein
MIPKKLALDLIAGVKRFSDKIMRKLRAGGRALVTH